MSKFLRTVFAIALCCVANNAVAGVIFNFTESGGNVRMQSYGTLDTSKLVRTVYSGFWGGRGLDVQNSYKDIMGDTVAGFSLDRGFTFHAGTDTSGWSQNMFTRIIFDWNGLGSTEFATYALNTNFYENLPGISIASSDMVGSLWTPDISWSRAGTFFSTGLTPGKYTIQDSVTEEAITIHVGPLPPNVVPEPTSMAVWSFGAILFGIVRTRRKK